MRILVVCNYSLLYGANRSLMTILDYLKSKGYNILVLLPSQGPMVNELTAKNIEFKVIRFYSAFLYIKLLPKHIIVPLLFILDIFLFPYLLFITKRFNPDLIYSNTSAENLGIIISKTLNIKHISNIREFISLDHGAYFILGRKLKKKFIDLSDGVIFVSNAVAQHVLLEEPLEQKHIVIYNGITINQNSFENKPLPYQINFGLVGVLQESKGHHLGIEYFSKILNQYPNAKLHIFGEGYGHYEQKLISLIKKYNLENKVLLHGFVSDAQKIYKSIDVLCMFSRSEGFGRVTGEAMLRGIPVIGLKKGGTVELIKHEQTGFLIDDYESFSSSVSSLFKSEENYNKIRQAAYIDAQTLFSSEKYTIEVDNFIKKIVQ